MIKKNTDIAPPPEHFDPDTPLTDDEFEKGRAAYLAYSTRKATGLSQSAFAAKYGIPVATLRDWEQGRRRPDKTVQSYLRVIQKIPDEAANALVSMLKTEII
ncbi:MAG: helix-turn-helix domain-containing protein [Alphaproteobacteria bacterium]